MKMYELGMYEPVPATFADYDPSHQRLHSSSSKLSSNANPESLSNTSAAPRSRAVAEKALSISP